ncbi:hypothetical protein [Frigoribacterium sp. 9N]|uniref:hypothetical protein n=1 Tax=Frigoribacterium sp. 9N TaxID=2653144 RepID=UPI0012EEF41D|nr:hypothetical protein [Frigoribacterium sp. 9N]VXB72559.1 hypothetical protein FRIGORI9N_400123 [Frigoribacterium sp. 9N]
MSSADLSSKNHHRQAIQTTLSRARKQHAFNRLLAGTVRGLALGMETRGVLGVLRTSTDVEVAALSEDVGVWQLAVSRAGAMLALKGLENGNALLLERGARRLAVGVLSGAGGERLAGAGGGKSVEVPTARAFAALVGKQVLTDVMERGMDTAVVSITKWEAEYASSFSTVAKSLDWGGQQGILMSRGRSASGAARYALGKPKDDELVRRLVDVNEHLIGLAGGCPRSEPAEQVWSDDLDDLLAEEDDRELLDDIAARRAKRVRAGELSGKRFTESDLTSAWTPTGLMKGLDPTLAAKVTAEILWTVDSVLWRSGFTGEAKGLTWGSWLTLLAGAAGLGAVELGAPAVNVRKPGRVLRHFPELVQRLNAGESFVEMVRGMETEWALAKREQRLEEWRAYSAVKSAERTAYTRRAELAASDAEFIIATVGIGVPKPSADRELLDAWLMATAEVARGLGLRADEEALVAANYRVRMGARKYTEPVMDAVVQHVLPATAA